MQVCGKNASYTQGFRKLWKTKKVNTVYKKLTQNSRELNIYKFLTFLTQNLHLTKNLLNLNKNLINTILTQNLQDLNTENRPHKWDTSCPTSYKISHYVYTHASCKLEGKLQAGVGCYTSKATTKTLLNFR